MPCRTYDDEPSPAQNNTELNSLRRENINLEAGLCAIITELEKRNIAQEIIPLASKNGGVDLLDFWEHHKQVDIERLLVELNKFSEHEREILKTLLNK